VFVRGIASIGKIGMCSKKVVHEHSERIWTMCTTLVGITPRSGSIEESNEMAESKIILGDWIVGGREDTRLEGSRLSKAREIGVCMILGTGYCGEGGSGGCE
jgi:hypothetical protein